MWRLWQWAHCDCVLVSVECEQKVLRSLLLFPAAHRPQTTHLTVSTAPSVSPFPPHMVTHPLPLIRQRPTPLPLSSLCSLRPSSLSQARQAVALWGLERPQRRRRVRHVGPACIHPRPTGGRGGAVALGGGGDVGGPDGVGGGGPAGGAGRAHDGVGGRPALQLRRLHGLAG